MNILILIISLPSEQATLRMRVWRTLKSSGAAVLRDGVYLLPEHTPCQTTFDQIASDVIASGGTAYTFITTAPASLSLSTLFDRTEHYSALLTEFQQLHSVLTAESAFSNLKTIRKLRKEFSKITDIDFFPSGAQSQAEAALEELELRINQLISPDEPHAMAGTLSPLSSCAFRGRIWGTRQRPWVDRLASAWLILRFIDPDAQFIWLDESLSRPDDTVGFDFDGAMFSHVDSKVTFEVLLRRFGLENDALNQMGLLVHYLDVGGIQPPEAAGVESILAGLRDSITDDDLLLATACLLFDGLLVNYKTGSGNHE
ncbi:chromate resistance protein ChrB domain-containing protein [Pseudescherichia vulneris]|uniref:chromate resistance protein ChrB domain-containing protein n=1 Tax=Pseudescherichia vulneris TaxID=566 RepID=UPI003016363E